MVTVELVQSVNSKLRELQNVFYHGGDVRSVVEQMLTEFVRLTDVEAFAEQMTDEERKQPTSTTGPTKQPPVLVVEKKSSDECQHENIDIYGRCLACRKCVIHHPGNLGYCNTCGEPTAA